MSIQTFLIVTGQLDENCYFLWRQGSKDAIVFDPGADEDVIESELKQRGFSIAAFLQTHCHGDHIGALTPLKALYPSAKLYVPEAEAEWLQRPTLNLSYFMGVSITGPKPDELVRDGDILKIAGMTMIAIHIPGHSPGGTAYYVESGGETPHLFCGDILFKGGIGRTDFPGSAGEDALVAGIREKLFVLPEATIVHPGHGPQTTIGKEKLNNPFCALE